jgi:hypothetical protein
MEVDSDYLNYRNSIIYQIKDGNLNSFKSSNDYISILEHVSQDLGNQYYDLIKKEFFIDDEQILKFCELNDFFGNPTKYLIKNLNILVSPTSLRYIFHSFLIIDHIRSLNLSRLNIIEIGAGYGGLALCMNYFGSADIIESYTCIDFPEVLQLQKLYLSKFQLNFPVSFVDCSTFGCSIDKPNIFLISNYGFSEISETKRNKYSEILIPKVEHGFMAWCGVDVYDFGKGEVKFVDERPMTGGGGFVTGNKFVYF